MAAECSVDSEIEVLQSIYLDELTVTHGPDSQYPWLVSITLFPSTAQDCDSQYVRLTLSLALPAQYPSCPPKISIHNPRGLSDEILRSVQQCLESLAQSSAGAPVLYELIEKAKEILTDSNIPHGQCVICLYAFQDGEVFTKTQCYHYFHSHCLGRYVTHSERELGHRLRERLEDKTLQSPPEELTVVCPVCREPLTYDLEALQTSPAPQFPKETFSPGAGFRQQWEELKKVLERQRARGGVIDPEAERNKFLIHINEGPAEGSSSPDPSSQSASTSVAAAANQPFILPEQTPERAEQANQSERRGGRGTRKGPIRPESRDLPTSDSSGQSQGRKWNRFQQPERGGREEQASSQWEAGEPSGGSQSEKTSKEASQLQEDLEKLCLQGQTELASGTVAIAGNSQCAAKLQEGPSQSQSREAARAGLTPSDKMAEEGLDPLEPSVNGEGLGNPPGSGVRSMAVQSEVRLDRGRGQRLTGSHPSQLQHERRSAQEHWDSGRRWGQRRDFVQSQPLAFRRMDQSEAQLRKGFHPWEGGGRGQGYCGNKGWSAPRRGGGASRRKGRGLEQRGGDRERRTTHVERE